VTRTKLLDNQLGISRALESTPLGQSKAFQEKNAILGNKLEKQLEKLLAFSGLKVPPKTTPKEKVEKIVEGFLNNCDILTDKVEQFGEKKKKMLYVPKSDAKVETVGDSFFHARARAQNDPSLPFIPIIREKPHGQTPINSSILKAATNPTEFFRCIPDPQAFDFGNPYEAEIKALSAPSFRQLEVLFSQAHLDKSLTGRFVYVQTEDDLQAAIAEISAHKLVSVDLEFHLEHSFLGFACLIQISVEGCDYVIDPLPLFEKLWILNFIFANPAITKIFHGSDADIMMLQKDFGVYLVNLVDTYRLALITNNASCALGSLLQSPNQRLL
jgi:hypothetical protein